MGIPAIPSSPGHAVFGGTMSVGKGDQGAVEYDFIMCEKCPARETCKELSNFRRSDMPKAQQKNNAGPGDWNKCFVANVLLNRRIFKKLEATEKIEEKKTREIERRSAFYEEKIKGLARKVVFLEKMLNEEKSPK
jgi:hypothetical protein